MNKRKVVIVGASHPGHEAANELLDKYDDVDVTIYEASHFVSFMSCGMKLFLEGKTTGQDNVRNFAPEDLAKRGGQVIADSLVTAVHPENKTISVKHTDSNQEETVSYDKLIITSGVKPANLPVAGNDLENVFLMRGYGWASKINEALHDDSIKNIVVVGAGNGISAVEAAKLAGKNVTLIDAGDRPLGNYMPKAFTDVFEAEFKKNNVQLLMNTKVEKFEGKDGKLTTVVTDQGNVDADLVIVTAGIKPNTDWLKGSIELAKTGYVQTDEYFRTSAPDVYAIGDVIWPYSIPGNVHMPVPSASASRHEAQYLVDHLFEAKPTRPFRGLVGAQVLEAFDAHAAITGLNERSLKFLNVNAAIDVYEDHLRPAYIPEEDNPKVHVYLIFNKDNHQILGGGVLSSYDITAQTNVLSLAIGQRLTLEDLSEQDFFFSPSFDRQWSLLNLAAQHALGWAPFDR
ncbi:NADH peroxidase [Lactobacillus colini]|uniref:NADH peroxidase n=1 Tax=Lactobacillus colini TaxID=1819254 RepID=A0ABS4MEA1_9LACO|nr:FAD-dependent oxidoreductase [Lactobacillus colini]MBP2058008.1 NADH peroxidase [Lactobacillus colini]